MTKKSLCVVTGTRAEYGLLRPVLQKLLQSDVIEPRLVVTGAHLAPEFGNTVSEIEADGMPIAARIPILKFGTGSPLANSTASSIRQSGDLVFLSIIIPRFFGFILERLHK